MAPNFDVTLYACIKNRSAWRISAHAHTPAHYFDRQLFRGQYDQNMNVVYIVHKNAKMQIKIKMSIQNTIDSVPVCICDFRSAGIHFPMSHWADTESMRVTIPVNLKQRNENFTAVCVSIAIFRRCDQFNLNSHRLQ